MKKFLLRCALWLALSAAVSLAFGYYMDKNGMPIHYTNSISRNAKIFAVQHLSDAPLEFIAMGASLTLNNINSEVITEKLGKSYYNFSSWGLNMSQIHRLGKFYVERYHPRLMICATTANDFRINNLALDTNYSLIFGKRRVVRWLYTGKNIARTLGKYKRYRCCTSSRSIQESLLFDAWGGVPLDIPEENIDRKEWSKTPDFKTSESQYEELRLLSGYLREHNVCLVLAQMPYREDALGTLNLRPLNEHIERCKKILAEHEHVFLDYAYDKEIASHNEYYTDINHLNERGARVLTLKLAHDIDSLGVLR